MIILKKTINMKELNYMIILHLDCIYLQKLHNKNLQIYFCYNNGKIIFDNKNNCLYIGGEKIITCDYHSFSNQKIGKLTDLTVDRTNA